MMTLFHARLYGRFVEEIEIQSNHRRKKVYRTNQGINFLRGSQGLFQEVRACMQFFRERSKKRGVEMLKESKKGKIFENLGKSVKNLKIF